jgi:mannose-6-phosphate isomerase-like protein (cupin superfamily)
MNRIEAVCLKPEYDYRAPDGSEIRLLIAGSAGSLCHCTLQAGGISSAVYHETVEEIWYCLSGHGEVWRKYENNDVTPVYEGVSLNIPTGIAFQFRNNGTEPLCFLITTMPPWQEKKPERMRLFQPKASGRSPAGSKVEIGNKWTLCNGSLDEKDWRR